MRPHEIRKLRERMGQTRAEFADNFGVDENSVPCVETIKSWESPETSTRHRRPGGPALVILRQLRRKLFGEFDAGR